MRTTTEAKKTTVGTVFQGPAAPSPRNAIPYRTRPRSPIDRVPPTDDTLGAWRLSKDDHETVESEADAEQGVGNPENVVNVQREDDGPLSYNEQRESEGEGHFEGDSVPRESPQATTQASLQRPGAGPLGPILRRLPKCPGSRTGRRF